MRYNLPQDQIERLEEIGFKWKVVDHDKKFDQRCLELEAFKKEFGHCRVPHGWSVDPNFGNWCNAMRVAYNQLQQGIPTIRNISQDRIERLDAIGFIWKLADFDKRFEQHCHDLEAYKRKFGHCNAPQRYSADPSLGRWCKNIRVTYNRLKQGKPAMLNISQDQIDRLEDIGFKWIGCRGRGKNYL